MVKPSALAVLRSSPIRRIGHLVGTAGGSLADDGRSQELATWSSTGSLDRLVRSTQHRLRDCQPERFRGLEVDHEAEAPAFRYE